MAKHFVVLSFHTENVIEDLGELTSFISDQNLNIHGLTVMDASGCDGADLRPAAVDLPNAAPNVAPVVQAAKILLPFAQGDKVDVDGDKVVGVGTVLDCWGAPTGKKYDRPDQKYPQVRVEMKNGKKYIFNGEDLADEKVTFA